MGQNDAMERALTEIVSRGDFTVPPFPGVALRLQRLLARDGYGVGEVADVIATDAALAAAVLAAANSAMLSGSAPITTLSRAVNRLGARTVGSIAVASGLGESATSSGVLFDVKFRVWRRSIGCALLCQKLAPVRGVDAEDAFLAGLLYGFGRSIAITSLERLLETHPPPRPLAPSEWLAIAQQHRAALARAVARAWQLPEAIARATQYEPGTASASALDELSADADRVAGELDAGRTPQPPRPNEASLMEAFIASLPNALTALAPAPTTSNARPHPALAKPEHALQGELRKRVVKVADRRAKAAADLSCVALGPDGIEVESTRPFQESSVVRLAVGEGEPPFEPWMNVVLCSPNGARYRVELQLFSPNRETREQWRALYAAG